LQKKAAEAELRHMRSNGGDGLAMTNKIEYVECLLETPWTLDTTPELTIQEAKNILESDHYGLEDANRRILEFLAVRKALMNQLATSQAKLTTTSPSPPSASPTPASIKSIPSSPIQQSPLPSQSTQPHRNLVRTPILCLVGPPGVGKTSIGASIAKALSRKFVRVALGGVYDQSDIRGHRKTYISAMPGRIMQVLMMRLSLSWFLFW
jgi:ATP-dependent Lon protease